MRSIAPLALALGFGLLAIACGGSSATGPSLDGGGGGDGGGGCGAPPSFHCYGGCNGETTSAECIDGSWTCPPEPEIACPVDSGVVDSGSDGGITGDASFACQGLTCNATTQYCDIRGGGVQLPDAGSNFSIACLTLPTMPCDAGTGCACIPNVCGCTEDGGAITNECLYP